MRRARRAGPEQDHDRGQRLERGAHAEGRGVAARHIAHHAHERRPEGEGELVDPDHEAHELAEPVTRPLGGEDEAGQRGQISHAQSEERAARVDDARRRRPREQGETGDLNTQGDAGHRAAIHPVHEETRDQATDHRGRGGGADRARRSRRTEGRRSQRDEVSEHADLRRQSEGKGRGDTPEAPRPERVAAPARLRARGRSGGGGWDCPAVWTEAELRGTSPHHPRRRGEHPHEHGDGGDAEGAPESDRADEGHEGRRDEHAAQRRSVERDADGQAAAALEPGGEDDVDGGSAHGAPAHRHQEERGIKLPRPRDLTERGQAGRHGHAAHGHDRARPEALVQIAHDRGEKRARHVVHGDGRRHRGSRPSEEPLEGRDVDAQTIEAEAEAEQGHDEGRGHHVPAVKVSCAHVCRAG